MKLSDKKLMQTQKHLWSWLIISYLIFFHISSRFGVAFTRAWFIFRNHASEVYIMHCHASMHNYIHLDKKKPKIEIFVAMRKSKKISGHLYGWFIFVRSKSKSSGWFHPPSRYVDNDCKKFFSRFSFLDMFCQFN